LKVKVKTIIFFGEEEDYQVNQIYRTSGTQPS